MASESNQPMTCETGKKPRRALLGKKLGMSQVFTESGQWVPATVLQVGPCTILQVKTSERDGYCAVQLGFDETKKKRKKPQQAVLEKLGVAACKYVHEVPFVEDGAVLSGPPKAASSGSTSSGEAVPSSDVPTSDGGGPVAGSTVTPKAVAGAKVGVAVFKDSKRVDVRGVSKGRGFAGVIRRYHFAAGPKSHGSKNIREPKSTGMHTDPGRVLPGKRMPGHLGAANRKARNLEVLRIEEADNILVVKGAVPGPKGGYVYVEESLR